MKRILIRALIALIAFTLGIAFAAIWIKRPSTAVYSAQSECPDHTDW